MVYGSARPQTETMAVVDEDDGETATNPNVGRRVAAGRKPCCLAKESRLQKSFVVLEFVFQKLGLEPCGARRRDVEVCSNDETGKEEQLRLLPAYRKLSSGGQTIENLDQLFS